MRQTFDIFIGGPMGGDQKDDAGLAYSAHIKNLETALERIAAELNNEQSLWHVRTDTPEIDGAGMITPRVFDLLDRAELGVMDISANSPSVMYELAMLHALGTPTIPVTLRVPDKSLKVPFYLKGTYLADVSSFESDDLYDRLRPMIRTVVIGGGLGDNPSDNPMTSHYGIPLMDISATTGLATGYFHNFLQHVIKEKGGVFSFLRGEVDQLIVIRPDSLHAIADLKEAVDFELQRNGIEIEQVGSEDGKIYTDREQARGQMLVYRAGRYLYDVPSALKAQDDSPRMKRVRKLRIKASGAGEAAEQADSSIKKFEQNMINEFIQKLQFMADTYPNVNPNRLDFKTTDEFVKMVLSD